jgi:putative ABC transport system substrate-binding protein
MKRRDFITLLGSAAAWPLTARAQQAGKIYRIGFLANDPAIPTQPAGRAFLEGLQESGFCWSSSERMCSSRPPTKQPWRQNG